MSFFYDQVQGWFLILSPIRQNLQDLEEEVKNLLNELLRETNSL
jgi:hypothetical protein